MTEQLKTLKDLEEQDSLRNVVYAGIIDEPFTYVEPSLLRNEAIKWIMNYRTMKKENTDLQIDQYSWMEFFNISEEDLK